MNNYKDEENITIQNIAQCYAIHCDFYSIKFSDFFNKINNIGEVIILNNMPYVWLDFGKTKVHLRKTLDSLKIGEYFCELIHCQDVLNEVNPLTSWYLEHCRKYLIDSFNNAAQEKLKEMLCNIQQIQTLLDQQKQNSTEQANNKKSSKKKIIPQGGATDGQ